MSLLANQITIAVTVYSRRQFIKQAVASALNQSVPVRVLVVEDCGPDPDLKSFVLKEFGSKIQYIRNPARRGLFGNWNVCLDLCGTEWLSILHDDDYLAPGFVEAMIDLERQAPGQALYFGRTIWVDGQGRPTGECPLRPVNAEWHKVGLRDVIYGPPFDFPGQFLRVSAVKDAGGFRESSYYTGDWEMWAKLIAREGAAQTARVVAYNRRDDFGIRESNAVIRSGRQKMATYMQMKRVLAMMSAETRPRFDRVAYLRKFPFSTLFLLQHGASLRPRLLGYHIGLLLLSRPPHWRYALYRACVRIGGASFVRTSSIIWNRTHRT